MATDTHLARKIFSSNPATGEVLGEFECVDAADVCEAVKRARSAQQKWSRTPLGRRREVLKAFQRLLNERKQQVARVITSEAGKPYFESLLTEILVVLDTARFLFAESHGFLRDK